MYYMSSDSTVTPSTQGQRSPTNDNVIIGASVAAGIALFIIMMVVGVLCIACIIIRKKKVYKKYVLPYRTYMYGKSAALVVTLCRNGLLQMQYKIFVY